MWKLDPLQLGLAIGLDLALGDPPGWPHPTTSSDRRPDMGGWWITTLGTAAGLCTVGSFVPQMVKTWREGDTNAISLRMYLVLVAGFVLWLGYGLMITSWPIVLVNVGNLVLSAAILWLKLRDSKRVNLGRIAQASARRHSKTA